MAKRTDYPNLTHKDYWPTIDPRAITPLVPFIKGKTYGEVCYGKGDLERLIGDNASCVWRSDVVDHGIPDSSILPAEDLLKEHLVSADTIITNPPYSWDMLKPLLDHLPTLKPTWLLLPADRIHTKRMGPYMKNCSNIVSIGRLKWFRDNDHRLWDEDKQEYKKNSDPMDSFAWMEFRDTEQVTVFTGR